MDSEGLGGHNMRNDHPPFCSPCAVTIYDQDCLMEDGATWVSWTANLTPEKVLAVLARAEAEVRSHIEAGSTSRTGG